MSIGNLVKSLAVSACALLGLCAGSAQATPWVFTISGVVDAGYATDPATGGMVSAVGKHYTLTWTLDPALYQNQVSSQSTDSHFGYGAHPGPLALSVTLDEVTNSYQFAPSSNDGHSFLSNGLTENGFGPLNIDQAYQYQKGSTPGGTVIYSWGTVFSYVNAFNLSLDYDQNWSYVPQQDDLGYARFRLEGGFSEEGIEDWEDKNPTFISINAASNIPEPSTLALLGLALFGIGAVRRRMMS